MAVQAEIRERLVAVRGFTVQARSTGSWQATGQGRVRVEQPENQIIWRETGHWQMQPQPIEFSNVYRWSVQDDVLNLQHLRYGDHASVQLVQLKQTDQQTWDTLSPHCCGEDEYALTMNVLAEKLVLNWRISGPEKNQNTRTCYHQPLIAE